MAKKTKKKNKIICSVCGNSVNRWCPWYGVGINGVEYAYHPYGECREVMERIINLGHYLEDDILKSAWPIILARRVELINNLKAYDHTEESKKE